MWGATRQSLQSRKDIIYFNPRPPCGGRHKRYNYYTPLSRFQSTPPVWGATYTKEYIQRCKEISIHAPRVGGDLLRQGLGLLVAFQSTPPVWGATVPIGVVLSLFTISIHAPRVGGDLLLATRARRRLREFQSTPPVWGATVCGDCQLPNDYISIHAPRVGGDIRHRVAILRRDDFNPRPPCGGRLTVPLVSTAPITDFNPRPPCGGRPMVSMDNCAQNGKKFQSTPPVWGATAKTAKNSICSREK